MKTHLFAALAVAGITLAACNLVEDHELLAGVQSGELELHCEFATGRRQINPAKVVDFKDGRWLFTNGSAKNCEVVK